MAISIFYPTIEMVIFAGYLYCSLMIRAFKTFFPEVPPVLNQFINRCVQGCMGLDFQEEIHNPRPTRGANHKSLPKKRARFKKFIKISYFRRFVRFIENYYDFYQDLLLTHSECMNFYFGLISVPAQRLQEQLIDLSLARKEECVKREPDEMLFGCVFIIFKY